MIALQHIHLFLRFSISEKLFFVVNKERKVYIFNPVFTDLHQTVLKKPKSWQGHNQMFHLGYLSYHSVLLLATSQSPQSFRVSLKEKLWGTTHDSKTDSQFLTSGTSWWSPIRRRDCGEAAVDTAWQLVASDRLRITPILFEAEQAASTPFHFGAADY